MDLKEAKENLKLINADHKNQWKKLYFDMRPRLIELFNELNEEYLKADNLNKYYMIHEMIYYLSFYKDKEVLELLGKYNLTLFTQRVFIDHEQLFDALEKHEANSSFLFPFEMIVMMFNDYSKSIVKDAICKDLDIDAIKIAQKVHRQFKDGNKPELLEEYVKRVKLLKSTADKENVFFRLKENNPFTSATHEQKFPHIMPFKNLYYALLDFNQQVCSNLDESNFKVEFYNLMELILRDKAILNNNKDAQLNYGELGNTRFKIKRVESLFLRKN